VLLTADTRLPSGPGPARGPPEFLSALLDELERTDPAAKVSTHPDLSSPAYFAAELTVSGSALPDACEAGRERFTDALEGLGMAVLGMCVAATPKL
jgi:hypothetical protein